MSKNENIPSSDIEISQDGTVQVGGDTLEKLSRLARHRGKPQSKVLGEILEGAITRIA